MAVQKVIKVNEYMNNTVSESDFKTTGNRIQSPPKSVFKLVFHTRREITKTLANLGVVQKTEVDAIVEKCLTK